MANDMRTRISTLWVVVMFSMVFADILTGSIPEIARQLVEGNTDVEITEELMLVAAVFILIPIAMIYLSRVLGDTANRWTNTLAALITAAFIAVGAEFVLHYYFFAVVQFACLSLIVRCVWRHTAAADTATPTRSERSTPASQALLSQRHN